MKDSVSVFSNMYYKYILTSKRKKKRKKNQANISLGTWLNGKLRKVSKLSILDGDQVIS